jgi:signal transduction histidine kinase
LQEIIQDLIDRIGQNSETGTQTTLRCAVDFEPSDDLKLNIYRIVQEQLHNISKHAEAKKVNISIGTEGKNISICIEDDGKGFDTTFKKPGIGIRNMINRVETFNGNVKIVSDLGRGSKIDIVIPLNL